MSINPNNYIGVSATIVGYAASAPRNPLYDPEGTRGVKELPIPINEGYKKDGEFVETGTTWYNYVAAGSGVDSIAHIQKGDKVRIDDAKMEVREYKTKDGTEKLGISLRFGTVTVLESKAPAQAPSAPPESNPFADTEAPW